MIRAAAVAMLLASGPAGAADPPGRACADVRVGGESTYGCLNESLRALIPGRRPSSLDAPFRADQARGPESGLFNQAQQRERLGNSFGHSLVPQRPSTIYVSPLLHR